MEHYVIFYCDECDRLEPAITAFKKVQAGVSVHTVSDPADLLAKIKVKKPELLLLYFHDPEKTYMDVLKTIRTNLEGTNIPLLVYHELPEASELEKAFKDFRLS